MFEFLRARLQQGNRTSPFPHGGADFPARFRGLPVLDVGTVPSNTRFRLRSSLARAVSDGRLTLAPVSSARKRQSVLPTESFHIRAIIEWQAPAAKGLCPLPGKLN